MRRKLVGQRSERKTGYTFLAKPIPADGCLQVFLHHFRGRISWFLIGRMFYAALQASKPGQGPSWQCAFTSARLASAGKHRVPSAPTFCGTQKTQLTSCGANSAALSLWMWLSQPLLGIPPPQRAGACVHRGRV